MKFSCVEGCGSGSTGLLFQPQNKDYSKFVSITFPYELKSLITSGTITFCLDCNENLFGWKDNIYKFILRPVHKVACGWTHALIVCNNQVLAYGSGNLGQLGLGDCSKADSPQHLNISEEFPVLDIACGFRTSFILTTAATYVFGENSGYQLGLGHKSHVKLPEINHSVGPLTMIASGNRHTIGFKNETLFKWGTNTFGQLSSTEKVLKTPEINNFGATITKVCCGWNHSAVLTFDKKVWISGKGDLGQQGNSLNINTSTFHEVFQNADDLFSATENLFVIQNGKAFAWGWNEHGNLGTGDYENRNRPVMVKGKVKSISCGGAVSYFI